MKFLFIVLLIIAAAIVLLRLRRVARDRSEAPGTAPVQPDSYAQPPGTNVLAEETDARPEVAATALAAARASVAQDIPDEVLADVLLDTTPQQAARLFAGVSQDVMAGAIGQQTQGVHFEGQAQADDLARLSNLSSAVDDLDIWNFGDDSGNKSA
ncbi:hypothetical protein [Deinococcus fonticola]|uniref:hypothetical protein n=1 Tax=Deinococcus fonticola TaxID=2528713 RepID=UPI001F107975|nr:hypothetical protein [Deinococcus fonticola]